jgi:Xaa-Pro aminopeptidase
MGKDFAPVEIVAQKLEQACALLKKNDIDLWITFVQETSAGRERIFDYIAVGDLTWESAIAVARNGDKIVILGKFDEQPFRESNLYTKIMPYVQDFKEPMGEILKHYSPKKVALNYSFSDASADGITYGKFKYMEKLINEVAPQAEIVSAEHIVDGLISQKTPKEIFYIKEAVKITEEIFGEITSFLKAGRTEKEVYDFIQAKIASRGLVPSFETLVFSGDRGDGMGHGQVTENKIQQGDLLHVDMGVFYNGYASDLQRTWYFLRPGEDKAPADAVKGFETIRDAVEQSGNALKPGARGVELDTISRGHIVRMGYPEYPHALGHQVGRFVHDGGALLGPAWARYKNTPFMTVELNQVFTLEPSLNVPGFGAIGLEEDVIVTKDGAEYLSHFQRELWCVKS